MAAGSAEGGRLASGPTRAAPPEQSIERVARRNIATETTADGNVDTSRHGARNDHHNQVSDASHEPEPASGPTEARPASSSSTRRDRRRAARPERAAGAGRRGLELEGANKPQPVFLQDTTPTTSDNNQNNHNSNNNSSSNSNNNNSKRQRQAARPLILITEPNEGGANMQPPDGQAAPGQSAEPAANEAAPGEQQDKFEVIDGISYRIVAAVTKRPERQAATSQEQSQQERPHTATSGRESGGSEMAPRQSRFKSVRRKSSAFVSNLIHSSGGLFVPSSRSSHALNSADPNQRNQQQANRRLSIYELTKSPPPETSIEMYLNDRRRSSTVSAKFVQQQLEQQSTFESNYSARQQYFKDLNAKLIKQDKRQLLNVVANRGQIHRHSVDIAQLPLFLAQSAHSSGPNADALAGQNGGGGGGGEILEEADEDQEEDEHVGGSRTIAATRTLSGPINQAQNSNIIERDAEKGEQQHEEEGANLQATFRARQQPRQLASISEAKAIAQAAEAQERQQRDSLGQLSQLSSDKRHRQRRLASQSSQSGAAQSNLIVRRFQKFDASALSSAPSPDVKIGQRVAYKEYYGNEFGTIRWIGRVPQISPDWTVGVEFDNAIGEGDGSLNGRRYFIAKDCFAKFLPLAVVALVDQHVGRPEPGTMISVMSAAVRPGQMISIQRVSTVHVQHCFLNAPHQRPGAEFLAVNTRLHCQCPNCGPCAHVVKPPRTQRLLTPKNATHMCQFSTYTCCGMESSDEALCTYTGNKISSLPPPPDLSGAHYGRWPPPLGNSWMEGSGYLSQLQAEQQKLMPEEYRLGAAPEDTLAHALLRRTSSGRRHGNPRSRQQGVASPTSPSSPPIKLACDHLDAAAAAAACPDRPAGDPGHAHRPNQHRRQHRHRHKRKLDAGKHGGGSLDRNGPPGPANCESAMSPVYANLVAGHVSEPIEMQSSCGSAAQNDDGGGGETGAAQRLGEAGELPNNLKAADNNGIVVDAGVGPQNGSGAKLNDSLSPVVSGASDNGNAPIETSHGEQQHRQQAPLEASRATGPGQFDYEPSGRDVNEVGDVNLIDVGPESGPLALASQSRAHISKQQRDVHDDDDLELELRGPAVVQYRDSIENRYLFPTDDIIDSTLEADLETLSQARYGRYRPGARSSVSNCSSEDEHENLRCRWPAIRLARRRWRAKRRDKKGRRRRRGRSEAERVEWSELRNNNKHGQEDDNELDGNQGRHRGEAPHGVGERGKRAGHRSASGSSQGGSRRRHFGRRHKTPPTGRGHEQEPGHYEQVLGYGAASDDYASHHRNHRHNHYRHYRHSTSSRNIILKGLRSLVVSCLSANSQRRQTSARSTPTKLLNPYYNHHQQQQRACGHPHHHHHHHHNHHHHQRQHKHGRRTTSGRHSSSSAASDRCRSAGCRCGFGTSPLDEAIKPLPLGADDCDDGGCGGGGGDANGLRLLEANSEAILAGQLEQLQLEKTAATAFISCSNSADDGVAQLDATSGNHYVNLDHPARCHRHDEKGGANVGPDCGQPPLIEWRCCQMANWTNQQQQQQQQQTGERAAAWRQISSSSDCGFSSASQNSMNLTTNNSNRSSNDSNGHDEQRRLVAIYRRIAARLTGNAHSHNSNRLGANDADGQDDLLRLKRVLVELHSETCAACRTPASCSCQQPGRSSQPPPPPTNGTGQAEQFDDAHASRQEASDGTTTSVATTAAAAATTAATIQQVASTSETLMGARGTDQSDEHLKALTRPFELKLTLSFTPDPTSQNVAAQSNCGLKLSAAAADQAG